MSTSKKSTESATGDTATANPEKGVVAAADGAEIVESGATDKAKVDTAEPDKAAPVAVKKSLGTKEVIPFAWKVIGRSGEMILTLFKSVERADADAHHARLTKDGAYKDLEVVALNHKIVQPKSVKEHFVAKAFRDKSENGSSVASGRKAGSKSKGGSKAKKEVRKETRITAKKSSKKSASPAASKKAPKKTVKKSVKKAAKKAAKKAVKKSAKKVGSAAKKTTTPKKSPAKKTVKKKTAAKSKTKKKAAKKKK